MPPVSFNVVEVERLTVVRPTQAGDALGVRDRSSQVGGVRW